MEDDFGGAFGARVKALRESAGATQDQIARAITRADLGFQWTRARVAQVEAGDASPDVGTMHAVAVALSEVAGKPLRMADLLPEEGGSEQLTLWREALTGAPVRGRGAPRLATIEDPRMDLAWGQVEDKVAQRFPGLDPEILSLARELYGHSGTEERDERAGEGATPQRRGHATRVIVRELVAAMDTELAEAARIDAAVAQEDY